MNAMDSTTARSSAFFHPDAAHASPLIITHSVVKIDMKMKWANFIKKDFTNANT